MGFKEALDNGKFAITVELSPPLGVNVEPIISIAKKISGKVDAVNITDNQRAVMRMSSIAASHILTSCGIEPIMQICLRDKNRIYAQSEVLGASALGIKNICIMTGDHPVMGDHPAAKPVFDVDSVSFIKIVKGLIKGISFSGKILDGSPELFIGAVANPYAEPFPLQMAMIKKKIAAGADFFQTQPFFDIKSAEDFLEVAGPLRSNFLIGIVPLKSVKMIEFMNNNVLAKPIPKDVARRIEDAKDSLSEGLRIASELIDRLKGKAAGVHIMPIGLQEHLPSLLEKI